MPTYAQQYVASTNINAKNNTTTAGLMAPPYSSSSSSALLATTSPSRRVMSPPLHSAASSSSVHRWKNNTINTNAPLRSWDNNSSKATAGSRKPQWAGNGGVGMATSGESRIRSSNILKDDTYYYYGGKLRARPQHHTVHLKKNNRALHHDNTINHTNANNNSHQSNGMNSNRPRQRYRRDGDDGAYATMTAVHSPSSAAAAAGASVDASMDSYRDVLRAVRLRVASSTMGGTTGSGVGVGGNGGDGAEPLLASSSFPAADNKFGLSPPPPHWFVGADGLLHSAAFADVSRSVGTVPPHHSNVHACAEGGGDEDGGCDHQHQHDDELHAEPHQHHHIAFVNDSEYCREDGDADDDVMSGRGGGVDGAGYSNHHYLAGGNSPLSPSQHQHRGIVGAYEEDDGLLRAPLAHTSSSYSSYGHHDRQRGGEHYQPHRGAVRAMENNTINHTNANNNSHQSNTITTGNSVNGQRPPLFAHTNTNAHATDHYRQPYSYDTYHEGGDAEEEYDEEDAEEEEVVVEHVHIHHIHHVLTEGGSTTGTAAADDHYEGVDYEGVGDAAALANSMGMRRAAERDAEAQQEAAHQQHHHDHNGDVMVTYADPNYLPVVVVPRHLERLQLQHQGSSQEQEHHYVVEAGQAGTGGVGPSQHHDPPHTATATVLPSSHGDGDSNNNATDDDADEGDAYAAYYNNSANTTANAATGNDADGGHDDGLGVGVVAVDDCEGNYMYLPIADLSDNNGNAYRPHVHGGAGAGGGGGGGGPSSYHVAAAEVVSSVPLGMSTAADAIPTPTHPIVATAHDDLHQRGQQQYAPHHLGRGPMGGPHRGADAPLLNGVVAGAPLPHHHHLREHHLMNTPMPPARGGEGGAVGTIISADEEGEAAHGNGEQRHHLAAPPTAPTPSSTTTPRRAADGPIIRSGGASPSSILGGGGSGGDGGGDALKSLMAHTSVHHHHHHHYHHHHGAVDGDGEEAAAIHTAAVDGVPLPLPTPTAAAAAAGAGASGLGALDPLNAKDRSSAATTSAGASGGGALAEGAFAAAPSSASADGGEQEEAASTSTSLLLDKRALLLKQIESLITQSKTYQGRVLHSDTHNDADDDDDKCNRDGTHHAAHTVSTARRGGAAAATVNTSVAQLSAVPSALTSSFVSSRASSVGRGIGVSVDDNQNDSTNANNHHSSATNNAIANGRHAVSPNRGAAADGSSLISPLLNSNATAAVTVAGSSRSGRGVGAVGGRFAAEGTYASLHDVYRRHGGGRGGAASRSASATSYRDHINDDGNANDAVRSVSAASVSASEYHRRYDEDVSQYVTIPDPYYAEAVVRSGRSSAVSSRSTSSAAWPTSAMRGSAGGGRGDGGYASAYTAARGGAVPNAHSTARTAPTSVGGPSVFSEAVSTNPAFRSTHPIPAPRRRSSGGGGAEGGGEGGRHGASVSTPTDAHEHVMGGQYQRRSSSSYASFHSYSHRTASSSSIHPRGDAEEDGNGNGGTCSGSVLLGPDAVMAATRRGAGVGVVGEGPPRAAVRCSAAVQANLLPSSNASSSSRGRPPMAAATVDMSVGTGVDLLPPPPAPIAVPPPIDPSPSPNRGRPPYRRHAYSTSATSPTRQHHNYNYSHNHSGAVSGDQSPPRPQYLADPRYTPEQRSITSARRNAEGDAVSRALALVGSDGAVGGARSSSRLSMVGVALDNPTRFAVKY